MKEQGHGDPDDQSDGGSDLEVDQRFHAYFADLFQIAHGSDALDDHAENDGRDHHADQRNERIAQGLQRDACFRGKMPDTDADDDGNEDLNIEDAVPGLVFLDCRSDFALAHPFISRFDMPVDSPATTCLLILIRSTDTMQRWLAFDQYARYIAPRGTEEKRNGLAGDSRDVWSKQNAARRLAL